MSEQEPNNLNLSSLPPFDPPFPVASLPTEKFQSNGEVSKTKLNECDIFGEFVASELKQLKSSVIRNATKRDILRLLTCSSEKDDETSDKSKKKVRVEDATHDVISELPANSLGFKALRGLADCHFGEANACKEKGDLQEAMENYCKAIEKYEQIKLITPDDAEVKNNIGTAYFEAGMLHMARFKKPNVI